MKKTSHKKPFRRTLAIICAATIAMLQCAVLLTVEPVHGAEPITVNARVGANTTTDTKEPSPSGGTQIPTEEGQKTGYQIGGFGIPTKYIAECRTGSNPINADDYLVENGSGSYDIYRNNAGVYSPVGSLSGNSIDVTMDESYWPVSFSIDTTSFTVTKNGSGKTLNATITWNGSFFEKDESKYIDIRWERSVGPGEVKFSTTNGKSTQVTFSKAGKFEIKATNTKRPVQVRRVSGEGIDRKDIKGANISGITDKTYNGKQQTQTNLKVTYNGVKLHEGRDYKVSYKNRTNVGTCTMVFEGIGEYSGSTKRTFEIKKDPNDKKKIDRGDVTIKVKSGERIKAGDSNSEIKKKLSVSVKNVSSPLKSSEWELLEYDKSKDRASIRIKVNGYETTEIRDKYVSTSSYSSPSGSYNRTRSTFRLNLPSNSYSSPSTGTTVPNVTYEPDRTITVKEVYLGEKIEDESQTNPMDETMTDPMDGSESTDHTDAMDVETPPLQFGPAAGSAAVAAAAAGAGAVGRIRRFKLDTATEAVEQVTNSEE